MKLMNSNSDFSLMNLSRFANFAWFVVGYNILVIIWGAFVRATKSGAGCGSHYPLCNGEIVPLNPTIATVIEFSHRATSGLALIFVLILLVWAFRKFQKNDPVRRAVVLSFIFILIEAAIGAFLVLFELVAHDVSIKRALSMSAHLVNTLILLFFLTLTAFYASGGAKILLFGQHKTRAVSFGTGALLTILVGMSGAVAALGNTLFGGHAAANLPQTDAPVLLAVFHQLQLWHPFLSILTSVFLVGVAQTFRAGKFGLWTRRFADATLTLVFIQLIFGALTLGFLAPIWMQLIHLLLAVLLWIAYILLGVSVLAKRQ